MISLGQSNTIISCPALTTHSELSAEALRRPASPRPRSALPSATRTRVICWRDLVAAAPLALDPAVPGFSHQFPAQQATAALVRQCYLDAHERYIEAKCGGAG